VERISSVIGLTESRSPNDLVKNILLRGSGKKNGSFVAATDTESTIVSFFSETENPGADFDVLVPAHKFLDIVRRIDDEEMEMNIHKNNWIEITLPSATFTFPCLPGKNFPRIPPLSMKGCIRIPVSEISGSLPSVLNFSSSELVRRNLNGVLFEQFEGKIRLVATDSHRLAYFQREVEGAPDFDKVVVPKKAVGEIVKIVRGLEKEEENGNFAEFLFEKDKVFFRVGQTTVISTPVDLPFPDYARVIPDVFSSAPVIVDKNKMLGAVRRVSVFSQEHKKVDLTLASSSLSFSSGQTEEGEGNESVPVEFGGKSSDAGRVAVETHDQSGGRNEGEGIDSGEPGGRERHDLVKVSFNPDFLEDSLNFLDGEKVEFRPGDGSAPAVFTLQDTKDFVCVVMPLVS